MEEDQSFAVSEALTEPILAQPALKKQLSTPTTFQTSPEGAAKSIPSKTSAEPKGGMAAYQAYLKKNLKTYGGMPQGSVSLTFELDRSGSPKKISVAKSLCTACDAEAIRLIENGPTWEANDSKEPVSIKVNFL
jgi:outer membrane biosynthesis protein TonB